MIAFMPWFKAMIHCYVLIWMSCYESWDPHKAHQKSDIPDSNCIIPRLLDYYDSNSIRQQCQDKKIKTKSLLNLSLKNFCFTIQNDAFREFTAPRELYNKCQNIRKRDKKQRHWWYKLFWFRWTCFDQVDHAKHTAIFPRKKIKKQARYFPSKF